MDVQTVTVVIAGISVIIGVINSILSNRVSWKKWSTNAGNPTGTAIHTDL